MKYREGFELGEREGIEWGVRRRDREREIQVGDMNRDKWERWRDARKDGRGRERDGRE